jgi:hypothetical protein
MFCPAPAVGEGMIAKSSIVQISKDLDHMKESPRSQSIERIH